ncbi:MTP-1 family protein [Lihuaxuella thermophila]|uniref:DUF1861 family protein n=1 Tax=Lihuaxuella thermophila TaxID=1173111 RepID=A0A1H8CJF4_9BACL|nr:DUF1861 family protein [Lihuaxuella thermophila]SEM94398.1 Protein of unknown function [Lihuaxuella thermophila]
MVLKKGEVKTCSMLLDEYRKADRKPFLPSKLQFAGVGGKDVYNITAPFEDEGEQVIAGRVESRDSEHSEVHFFVQLGETWVPKAGLPSFQLQDPFFTRIDGELIFGGVEIFPHPTIENQLQWRTVFYKGSNLRSLQKFFTGPIGMKDLRLIQLKDRSIGVLTRPQGKKGGRGKIGFTRIPSLAHLTLEVIEEAPLLPGQFIDEEWGGANEAHLLSNGLIGVLGHIACFDHQGNRHYYSMVFALDPDTGECSDIGLIAVRADFLKGPAKRSDLVDVVFSGGLVRKPDGTADLYAGISDAEAQRITIPDPFTIFEKGGE